MTLPAEFALIADLVAPGSELPAEVLEGPGDDAAVVALDGDDCLLLTCDAQVEGVHFLRRIMEPEQVGRRFAHVNFSDIAAMGGTPTWALVSLFLSGPDDESFVRRFYAGMLAAFREAGVALVGGNVSRSGAAGFAADMTLVGRCSRSQVRTRKDARPGDAVLVTGTLGDAAAGLALVQGRWQDGGWGEPLRARWKEPTARLACGRLLGTLDGVGACLDVSDGLVQDASHVARASGVDIELEARLLPIGDALRRTAAHNGADPYAVALGGGEDYELLFTVRSHAVRTVVDALAQGGHRAQVIGRVVPRAGDEPEVRVVGAQGRWRGFDHVEW